MKRAIIISASLVIVIATAVLLSFSLNKNQPEAPKQTAKPQIQMLLTPSEKHVDYQWLTSPDGNLIFTYHTALDNIAISVSEQSLPETFRDDPDSSLTKLAENYQATDKLDIPDMKAYIGASASGVQTVIAMKSGRLLLITSEVKIAETTWSNYLSEMKLSDID